MATLQQLSIFLENKLGRLHEIMEILGKTDIRIIASMVADTSEYGILRLITSDTQKAYQALKEHNISANLSEVIALKSDSNAGAFFDKLKCISTQGVEIRYMYSFSLKNEAFLIICVDDMDHASEVINKCNLKSASNTELTQL